MILSDNLRLIIAKSDKEGKWLPLWVHARDTAEIIDYLLRNRFQPLSEICGMDFNLFRKYAVLLAYLHDIGKITPLFQLKILKSLPERRYLFEQNGIDIPFDLLNKDKSGHSVCGEAILLNLGFPKGIASIVGAHHGMTANKNINDLMEQYPNHFYGKPNNKKLWDGLYKEWFDYSLEMSGFAENPDKSVKLNMCSLVLLSGLLIMADWLASDQTKFGLIDSDEMIKEYPEDRLERAVDIFDFPDVWSPSLEHISDNDFCERFGFQMNEIQKSVVETVEKCTKPGLFILEAPMGIGKTETALAAAEILACHCDKNGLFFGLPTQATANGIFERIIPWANFQASEEFHSISVNLAHSNSDFQPLFDSLKDSKINVDDEDFNGVTVNSFFKGNKQSLLADLVVGTVDRLLMSVLKKKHAMLLQLGLSQKVVIVDECHAYDAYMNRYLERALTWLYEYNVPVILLSATLPKDRRIELVKAYLNPCRNETITIPDMVYPRLTYIDQNEIKSISLPFNADIKEVRIVRSDDNCVLNEINRAVGSGACIGIICNTVGRAQHFAKMAGEIENANVILYHAQYVIPDRMKKEEILKSAVGKNSNYEQRKGTIVVGTQVLEQSLDIDFDILITDLCPMDLLLQRMGRLQRHPRSRPNGYDIPECIVLGTENLDEPSKKIYTEWLLMRTKDILPDTIYIPNDIDRLVCDTYSREVELKTEEEQAAFRDYTFLLESKQRKADEFLMATPKNSLCRNGLHGWLNNGVGDTEQNGLAAVRDGISSIEVIVLVKYQNGMVGFLPWHNAGKKYSTDICPLEEDCKLIAQQKLRLPSKFCYNIERTIGELEKIDKSLTGFQQSHWLKGELFLLLDEKLSTDLCGFKVTYSQETGLVCDKEV